MNKRRQLVLRLFTDWLMSVLAWASFCFYRKTNEFYFFNGSDAVINYKNLFVDMLDDKLFLGISFLPLCWLALYSFVGSYNKLIYKSRLSELGQTFIATLIGSLVLFFALFLDDYVSGYKEYYRNFIVFFALQFGLTYVLRLIITSQTLKKIHRNKLGVRTLIIGSNDNAVRIYNQMSCWNKYYIGYNFVGFVNVFEQEHFQMSEHIPYLGNYKNLKKVIEENKIENVIIAFEKTEVEVINEISAILDPMLIDVSIVPNIHDIVLGGVRQNNIWHEPLLSLNPETMPFWQQSFKRLFDIVFSVLAIVLLSPIYIFTAIMVKCSSPGPIFYCQERIGKGGKQFSMLKFRSMYVGSEKAGPQLSSNNDSRITPWGKFMRKVRLDEIPQFFTVLKGEMSIVGYRPERQFYIDQIAQKAPHYYKLLRIKPGITSWGEVKYGYAENVDEMVERLKYDILYIQNRNILIDAKILIYTVLIVVQGRGK